MSSILHITLLASEWKSSKGGLSTINRELAIQLAKQPNVSVSFLVPEYSENDKEAAYLYGINVIKAEMLTGYEGVERLVSPPESLLIDFVVGHGVVLGKQAQIIRRLHNCKWVQVVHTAPDELAMYKSYPGAISKGDEKQWNELSLCEKADLVIAIGPKLKEFYSAYLNQRGIRVYNLTPGIFHNLSSVKVSCQTGAKFRILVFGRGDKEDFAIKGYDIAAQAIAKLADKSYQLTFVGASSESENQLIEKLLEQGLDPSQLIVKGYQEDRDFLEAIMCASNLVLIPSRTKGFGLTALEALSAGLPFLVSQNSGFGEALSGIGTSFIVDSEDPNHWAEAIRRIRERGSEKAIQECQQLRTRYAVKYSWEKQCRKFVEIMQSLPEKKPSIKCQNDKFASLTPRGASALQQDVRKKGHESPSSSSTNQSSLTAQGAPSSSLKWNLLQVPNAKKFKAQGAPSSLLKRKLLQVPNEKKFKDLIPAFVRARGEKALAAYHRALETGGSTYDKRVKVLLIGQDRVGKTSLGKALRGEPFDEAELSTEGVQMIPAIKNAGTGAWRNPASLEHTTVFDHKVAAKTAEDLLSKHSEQPASNKAEDPISSKADEGKTPFPKQKEGSREVKENQVQKNHIPISSKADEGKSQLPRQEEVSSEVKENQAQKNRDEDLENQKKPFGVPAEIAIILEQHLDKNEGDTNEKIWPTIWDFAGQDIYRAIHPIFMSSDDIYLLVFDLTKRLSEKAECRVNVGHKEHPAAARDGEDTNLDHLLRWMDLIHSLKKGSSSDGLSYPPVILVGTHADCVDDTRKQINSLAEGKCSVVFDEDTYLPHIADYLPIDNTKSGKSTDQEEITGLRKKILELADKMPHTKRKIPLQWHRVEKEICQPVWQQEKYLLLESFQEKIVSRYCTFEDEGDFDELVYFLHGRGTIVYHEHEHDRQKVGLIVLNPQWLINVLCEIIKVKPDDNERLCIRKDREKLAEEGVLRERLIDHTCSKENVGLIKDSLISLMDKFNLICKWPEKAEETKKGESQILVPCMLTTFYEGEEGKQNAAPLYLTFQTKYVPYGLFCRLVVLFGKTSQFKNMYSLEYANEAKIALDNENHVLQLLCYKTVIKLQIFTDHGSTPSQKLYYDVWSELKKFLKKLRKECHWLHSMSYTLCARCTVCMGKATKPCARHEERSCRHHDCGHYIPLEGGFLCCKPGQMLEKEPLKPWIRAIEHVSKSLNLSSSRPESHDESWSLQVTESLKTASNPPEVTVTLLRNDDLPGKSVPLDKRQLPIDILLLTVKDWEFLACISCFNRDFCRSYCKELRQDVYLGEIGNDDMMLKIAVVKCYTGSTVPQGSCVVVMKAVEVLGPKAVFSVGCCGGLDLAKVKLGDVVVSVKLISYSSSKVTDKGVTERGVRVPLKANISKLMLSAAHGWKAPLKNPKEFEVEIHQGVFLTGPESVDSSARREALNQRFSEADVIEMEGEGVYAAAQELDIPWTIIKGVSNYADGGLFERNAWKKFASLMAASLTAHILSNPIAFKDWPHYQSTEEAS